MRHDTNINFAVSRLFVTSLALFACLAFCGQRAFSQRPAYTSTDYTTGVTTNVYADDRYGTEGRRIEITEPFGPRIVRRAWKNRQGKILEEEVITYTSPKNSELDPTGNDKSVVTTIFSPDGSGNKVSQTTTKTDLTGKEYSVETKKFDERGAQIGGSKSEEDATGVRKTSTWDPQKKAYVEVTAGTTSRPAAARSSVSAAKGFAVGIDVVSGLNTTTFDTPRGKIYVNLPNDISAGDTLSGTVVAKPEGQDDQTRKRNQSELAGYVVEIEKQQSSSTDRVLKLSIPAAISTTYLVLRDKKGKEVARCEVPIDRQPRTSPPPGQEFGLPSMGQQGNPMEIIGVFDGDFRTTNLTVGGEAVEILAESPRKLLARNTSAMVGPTQLVITEQGRTARGEFRNLGIRLSAPKLDLLRGEQTTLTVRVLGLEGIKAAVPLVLENKSPGVISMGSANIERISISPSQVQAGTYTTERPLTGIQRGAFTIVGTVTRDGK